MGPWTWSELITNVPTDSPLEAGSDYSEVLAIFENPLFGKKQRLVRRGDSVEIQAFEESWKTLESIEVYGAELEGSSFALDGEGNLWMCLPGRGGAWVYGVRGPEWFTGYDFFILYSSTENEVLLLYMDGRGLNGVWLERGEKARNLPKIPPRSRLALVREERGKAYAWVLIDGFELIRVEVPLSSVLVGEGEIAAEVEPPKGVDRKNSILPKDLRAGKKGLRARVRAPSGCKVSDSVGVSVHQGGEIMLSPEPPGNLWLITCTVREKKNEEGEIRVSFSPPKEMRLEG